MRNPDGDTAGPLKKSLYGLRRSPKIFYDELATHNQEGGYNRVVNEPCAFFKEDAATDQKIIFDAHVDNLIVLTDSLEMYEELKAHIRKIFKVTEEEEPRKHYVTPYQLQCGWQHHRDDAQPFENGDRNVPARRGSQQSADIDVNQLHRCRQGPVAPPADKKEYTIDYWGFYSIMAQIFYPLACFAYFMQVSNFQVMMMRLSPLASESMLSNTASCFRSCWIARWRRFSR